MIRKRDVLQGKKNGDRCGPGPLPEPYVCHLPDPPPPPILIMYTPNLKKFKQFSLVYSFRRLKRKLQTFLVFLINPVLWIRDILVRIRIRNRIRILFFVSG
jgi:hypothetical protein